MNVHINSISTVFITVLESIDSGSKNLNELAGLLQVSPDNLQLIKNSSDEGYAFEDVKLAFKKYLAFQERMGDLPVLSEFIRFFPALKDMIEPKGNSLRPIRMNNPTHSFVSAVLSNFCSVKNCDNSTHTLSTFIDADIRYVNIIKSLWKGESFDYQVCLYAFEKYQKATEKNKTDFSINEFLSGVDCYIRPYFDAVEIAAFGATKEQISVLTNITIRDVAEVRRLMGLKGVSYDSSTDHEGDCLYTYLQEHYEGQESYIKNGNLNKILIKLCEELDKGLPIYRDDRLQPLVCGCYKATFPQLLKLIEYNALYATHHDSEGKQKVFSILAERIEEQYANHGKVYIEYDNNYEVFYE